MASTISIPALSQVQTNVAELAKQTIAGFTAAVVDVEALQASSSGRDWKDSVRLWTNAALPANTRTGNVLLADANGALNDTGIDGKTDLAVGQRIGVKNEVTGANNGIYTITTLGAAGSKWSMTRSTDADSSAEVTTGMVAQAEEGTANAGKFFELTTLNITLNTTALTFAPFATGLVQTTDARLPPTPTAAAKIIYDNGTAYVATAAGTAAQVPVINAGATAPVFVSLSGDATISSTGVVTNAKVNGATYPAAGALTTGTVPRVTGASAVEYGALDLANASAVTGLLPTANQAPGTAAQIAVTNAGATAKVDVSVSGDATLAATGALTVTKVNGSLFQSGVATLVAGVTAAISATVTANTRIVAFLKTPNTTAGTAKYAALDGDRSVGAPGSFKITAIIAAGDTINNADVSTVDWIAFG